MPAVVFMPTVPGMIVVVPVTFVTAVAFMPTVPGRIVAVILVIVMLVPTVGLVRIVLLHDELSESVSWIRPVRLSSAS